MAKRIKMNVLTVGNQDFEIHDESAHNRIDEFGNIPFITHEEDADLELPIHTINDEETDVNLTWSSSKIQNVVDEALQANIQTIQNKITEAMEWKTIEDNPVGQVWVNIPSDATEVFFDLRLGTAGSGSNTLISVGFHVPVNDDVFFGDGIHNFVNHYTSTYDGYAVVGIRKLNGIKQVALRQLWNENTNVTNTTGWKVHYR